VRPPLLRRGEHVLHSRKRESSPCTEKTSEEEKGTEKIFGPRSDPPPPPQNHPTNLFPRKGNPPPERTERRFSPLPLRNTSSPQKKNVEKRFLHCPPLMLESATGIEAGDAPPPRLTSPLSLAELSLHGTPPCYPPALGTSTPPDEDKVPTLFFFLENDCFPFLSFPLPFTWSAGFLGLQQERFLFSFSSVRFSSAYGLFFSSFFLIAKFLFPFPSCYVAELVRGRTSVCNAPSVTFSTSQRTSTDSL